MKHTYLLYGFVLIKNLLQLHGPLNCLTSLLSMESLSGSCILTVTPARAKVVQEIYLLRCVPNFRASFMLLSVLIMGFISPVPLFAWFSRWFAAKFLCDVDFPVMNPDLLFYFAES